MFENQSGGCVIFCHVALLESEVFVRNGLADGDDYFSEQTDSVIFRFDMYGKDAAFGAVSEETDTALGIVDGGLFIGDTRALGEKTDVVALFQNLDGRFDCLQIACASVDGNRTEGTEDLAENRIFEEFFFCEKVDLTFQMGADEENVVHTDVVGADDASALFHLVFETAYLYAEEKLVDGSEEDL